VDDEVEILLGVVLGDLLQGEFLGGGHCVEIIRFITNRQRRDRKIE
jgi:hypothetical protein